MFRKMRRAAKEISGASAKEILRSGRYGVLAVQGDDGYPYAVPVNYFYDEAAQTVFFHGAKAGHKAEALTRCDKVCFTVCGPEVVRDEAWAPYVQSVVIFGRCRMVTDREKALSQLRMLGEKFYPSAQEVEQEIEKSGSAAQIYEIAIEHMTGKVIQEK